MLGMSEAHAGWRRGNAGGSPEVGWVGTGEGWWKPDETGKGKDWENAVGGLDGRVGKRASAAGRGNGRGMGEPEVRPDKMGPTNRGPHIGSSGPSARSGLGESSRAKPGLRIKEGEGKWHGLPAHTIYTWAARPRPSRHANPSQQLCLTK